MSRTNMKNKGFLAAVVLIVVAAAAVFVVVYVKSTKTPAHPVPAQSSQPLTLPFTSGTVSKVEGNTVFFSGSNADGKQEDKTAVVNDQTEIVQQLKVGKSIKLANVKIGDVKQGQLIYVYYSDKQDVQFTAKKIQIVK